MSKSIFSSGVEQQGGGGKHPFDLDSILNIDDLDLDLFAEENFEPSREYSLQDCSFTLSTITCDCATTLSTVYCLSCGEGSC